MKYVITFVAFVLFLLCQYAIITCSIFLANWLGVTGNVHWCVVLVAFLILNDFCFGAYDIDLGLIDNEDLEEYGWDDD